MHPFIITQYRQSVFEKINIIQLIMTLTDPEDIKEMYGNKERSEWDIEMTNLVFNKNENDEEEDRSFDLILLIERTVRLTPCLFINTKNKDPWKALYPDDYEANLTKMVDFIQKQNLVTESQTINPDLADAIRKVSRINVTAFKISLIDYINLTDEINLTDVELFVKDHLKLKFVKENKGLKQEGIYHIFINENLDVKDCIESLASINTLESMSEYVEGKYK